MNTDDDYEIGYGKPPKNNQFKKGQSGNPKGRAKGSKNFQTEVEDMLRSKVIVKEAGKPISVSTSKAALMRLKEKGLKGDQRPLERLLSYAQESSIATDSRSRERQLKEFELDILGRFELVSEADDREPSDDE
jgi:hypothetical protein